MARSMCTIPLVLLALGAGFELPASAAGCPVQIRLWIEDGDAWFDHGEPVLVAAAEPRPRLGVYVKSGRHPQATTAEWGFPKDFGSSSARPVEVAEHIRFVRQNQQDIDGGRLRFTPVAAGATYLGYRITGVAEPGSLDEVPEECRTGEVRIEIVGATEEPDETASSETARTLCQAAVREKVTSLSGASLDFNSGAAEAITETQFQVTVGGDLIVNTVRRPVKYGCLVDLEAGEVTKIEFKAP